MERKWKGVNEQKRVGKIFFKASRKLVLIFLRYPVNFHLMSQIKRLVSYYAFQKEWIAKKMIFLAGPRQVGKTSTARQFLTENNCKSLYYNFDDPEVTELYHRNPHFFESEARMTGLARPTLVLDEIHKRSKWKNELKGIFDRNHDSFNLIVTGSARLDLLRTTGESLAGRYFLFRMLPVGLLELIGKAEQGTSGLEDAITPFARFIDQVHASSSYSKEFGDLLTLGGFPDPLSQGSIQYRNKWAADYRRLILREDLRDLSRVVEIDRVEKLWTLLPDRVGAPLSVRSLQEDLGASHEAVSTWLVNLEKLYSIFSIAPFSRKLARMIKKEKKYYLMDWALVADESKRFENFVIASLFRTTSVWTDRGLGEYALHYLRNTKGQEADFMISKNGSPILLGDIKLSQPTIEKHLYDMATQLGGVPILQIVKKSGVFENRADQAWSISADRIFGVLP